MFGRGFFYFWNLLFFRSYWYDFFVLHHVEVNAYSAVWSFQSVMQVRARIFAVGLAIAQLHNWEVAVAQAYSCGYFILSVVGKLHLCESHQITRNGNVPEKGQRIFGLDDVGLVPLCHNGHLCHEQEANADSS